MKSILRRSAVRLTRLATHDAAIGRAIVRRGIRRENTVRQSIKGEESFEGDIWAIFVIYQHGRLPWYVRNALASLQRLGINVLAILNSDPDSAVLDILRESTREILVRDNSGFDFGGYRDGTLALGARKPSRVLYLNDSLFYFEEGLDALFRTLATSNADLCAAFDNAEVSYHLQSFCFSVSGAFFRSPAFAEFWARYLPVNSRKWAVEQGELAFSRNLLPTAGSVEVVYSSDLLANRLSALSLEDARSAAALLAPNVRIPEEVIACLDSDGLITEICGRVAFRSQVHNGGLLYMALAQSPLLKRDLVHRGVFDADELRALLVRIGRTEHLDKVMADLTRRTPRHRMSLWQRLLHDQGLA